MNGRFLMSRVQIWIWKFKWSLKFSWYKFLIMVYLPIFFFGVCLVFCTPCLEQVITISSEISHLKRASCCDDKSFEVMVFIVTLRNLTNIWKSFSHYFQYWSYNFFHIFLQYFVLTYKVVQYIKPQQSSLMIIVGMLRFDLQHLLCNFMILR